MKTTCELIGRESYEVITSTEVESSHFGISADNPFPCSDIWTGSFWPEGATIKYRVNEAFGDCGSHSFQKEAAEELSQWLALNPQLKDSFQGVAA